ncbi:LAMI_0A03884g1_1 [Lachancea mirantina]|uniref:LAMI_0A03884g1_1 n=1 Tax=Lachancea mirantina TaxID=1230905 RepID=A0A1G4INL6_9SACH|nr:LAMI_0A03884g1_1 [Lachancea mirantina]
MLKSTILAPFAPRMSNVMRTYSTHVPKIYNFEDVKQLVTKPVTGKKLIDVREPSELQQYAMPTALNLPLKTAPGALSLDPEEFKELFHFDKPKKDQELIFFCAAGIRAKAAEEIARSFGYDKTGVYPGSIQDWLKKGGDKIA